MSIFDIFPLSVEVGTVTGVRANNLNVIECDGCGTFYASVPWSDEVHGVSCEVCDWGGRELGSTRPTATLLGHINDVDVELSDLHGYEEGDGEVGMDG